MLGAILIKKKPSHATNACNLNRISQQYEGIVSAYHYFSPQIHYKQRAHALTFNVYYDGKKATLECYCECMKDQYLDNLISKIDNPAVFVYIL